MMEDWTEALPIALPLAFGLKLARPGLLPSSPRARARRPLPATRLDKMIRPASSAKGAKGSSGGLLRPKASGNAIGKAFVQSAITKPAAYSSKGPQPWVKGNSGWASGGSGYSGYAPKGGKGYGGGYGKGGYGKGGGTMYAKGKDGRGKGKGKSSAPPADDPFWSEKVDAENRQEGDGMVYPGTVANYNIRAGWGFILPDDPTGLPEDVTAAIDAAVAEAQAKGKNVDNANLIYFRKPDLAEGTKVEKGGAVEFMVYTDDKGAGAYNITATGA